MTRKKHSAMVSVGATALALALALGAVHLFVDGLASSVIPLQAVIRSQTGADPTFLGVLVAVAMASTSLFQPLGARAALKFGDGRLAIIGALLAGVGYGLLPAAAQPGHAIAAVAAGGLGSAMFHPAAGALVARSAPYGKESLPLAVFSGVGWAGSALMPVAILGGIHSFAGAAAIPFAAPLVAGTVALLFSRTIRGSSSRPREVDAPLSPPDRLSIIVPVAVASLLSLTGVTVMASAPLLLATELGPTNPLLGYSVAAYSAAAALGGILLAVWTRRTKLRTVVLFASGISVLASMTVPHLPAAWIPAAMAVAGAGLSGSLPVLVTSARRPGETSTGPAVARVLGLAAGLGAVGYAGIGMLHNVMGYGPVLTLTAAVAGSTALILLTRLSDGPSGKRAPIQTALSTCACGGCTGSTVERESEPNPLHC